MKTYIADIIPRIQRFSRKLDDLTKLTNQHWVSLGDINQRKRVFIFRGNNQLLISENGIVEKGTWEYLGNQSLLLETKHESYLLKHGFFDENVIALKLDSTDGYAFFVNETKYEQELNSIDDVVKFLEAKYLRNATSKDTNAKMKFARKDSLGNLKVPHYKEADPIEHFQLFESNFYTIIVTFDDGLVGTVFKRKSDNKYYFIEDNGVNKQFHDKVECIHDLYHKLVSTE